MADAAGEEPGHFAEVPAHKDPNRDPGDYVYLNKTLRACQVCKLIKSERQVGRCLRPVIHAAARHGVAGEQPRMCTM